MNSGLNFVQLRQDQVFERGAEFGAAVFGGQRRVDDVVVLAALASAPVPGNSGIWWVEQYITVGSAQKISWVPLP